MILSFFIIYILTLSISIFIFKGLLGAKLSGLKLPSSGTTTIHAQSSKRELEIKRKVKLKANKTIMILLHNHSTNSTRKV